MKNGEELRKEERLAAILAEMGGALVAFSGGVDSTYLLAMAKKVLKDQVVAVTAVSGLQAGRERESAIQSAGRLSARHMLVQFDILDSPAFLANSKNRCYVCKKSLFQQLKALAGQQGGMPVCHGANCDDFSDYRPGHQAALEEGIRAPLVDAGMNKAEIRLLSRKMGLDTWDKPAMACLASRIPFGIPISKSKLAMIESAEDVLSSLGFTGCRVRYHGPVARIETRVEDLQAVMAPAVRRAIAAELKKMGFQFVALDLEGYAQGSLNSTGADRPDENPGIDNLLKQTPSLGEGSAGR